MSEIVSVVFTCAICQEPAVLPEQRPFFNLFVRSPQAKLPLCDEHAEKLIASEIANQLDEQFVEQIKAVLRDVNEDHIILNVSIKNRINNVKLSYTVDVDDDKEA